jgi:O-antigen/teichoic acid export membrane protein
MVASAALSAVLSGGLQGLEVFNWFSAAAVSSSAAKLILTFLLVSLGYSISGALAAHFASGLIALAIIYFPLRAFIRTKPARAQVNYREMLLFLFPVAVANFAFTALASSDMILVKFYFAPEEAGAYSLAQMLGKIFLFLPGAVSMAMFPRASAMTAQSQDTAVILKRSLVYTFLFCAFAAVVYNFFPRLALGLLTGKSPSASIALGRMFSFSMSFYALAYVLLAYFLSLSDMRFVWCLLCAALLQCAGIILYHPDLFAVQALLCVNSFLLFISGAVLAFRKKR